MLRTFETDEEKYTKFKEICLKEGQRVGDKLNEFIEDNIKKHGDGNPAFTLDQFQDQSMKAVPAVFRDFNTWKSYLSSINKKEFAEFEAQMNTIITAYKSASKKVL